MKILLDENKPVKLKNELSKYEVLTVRDMNWDSYKNGQLLKATMENEFDIFITSDKNLQFQQNIQKLTFGIIVLDILLLKWSFIEPLIPSILKLIPKVKKGNLGVMDIFNAIF